MKNSVQMSSWFNQRIFLTTLILFAVIVWGIPGAFGAEGTTLLAGNQTIKSGKSFMWAKDLPFSQKFAVKERELLPRSA
ncbi:MAG: hypothetical protein HQM08_26395 [Candidatus Riflebacteria bacterium]|nr:hypothetical protein [Candidatus Riflebacteria bacterium]